jgi:hypothetical protein
MMERATINTNIRLNLNRPDDRQAWEYLQKLDRKKYKSYSRAIVAAINDYFSRQEQLACDPYLETREKEDAFLQKVLDTIREGVQASGAGGIASLASLLQSVQSEPASKESMMRDADLDVAMDFINSL